MVPNPFYRSSCSESSVCYHPGPTFFFFLSWRRRQRICMMTRCGSTENIKSIEFQNATTYNIDTWLRSLQCTGTRVRCLTQLSHAGVLFLCHWLWLSTAHPSTQPMDLLESYDSLDIIGRGSFGVIRKVRRKSDGLVSPSHQQASHRLTVPHRYSPGKNSISNGWVNGTGNSSWQKCTPSILTRPQTLIRLFSQQYSKKPQTRAYRTLSRPLCGPRWRYSLHSHGILRWRRPLGRHQTCIGKQHSHTRRYHLGLFFADFASIELLPPPI